ncbi:thioesterase II family protein [Amycolatopsis marina]|uniref:thioesterase II family protein n=1 Tax=Amycolatopsis marina TaxID=490629 RepID=UPI001C43559F|nr:alpha/beta fold hydrolase [Amycolatopsis marina]
MPTAAVLCFPPAGAGATFYRTWQVSDALRVLPVDLPGREKRYADPVPPDVGTLARDLAPDLVKAVTDVRKVAVFGHSFGAIVAYEAVRAMLDLSPGLDAVLVVSGSPGPKTLRGTRISGRDDDGFVAAVQAIAGYRHPALDDPELRELFLPTLRADVLMHENYQPGHRQPLSIPVVSMRGTADDVVPSVNASEWRDVTTAGFRLVEVPGGHMYLTDSPAAVLDTVGEVLHSTETGK